MKTRLLMIIGCICITAIGLYLNFEYHQNVIYPINLTNDKLDDIIASSDHAEINDNLIEVKHNLMSIMPNISDTTDADGKTIAKNPVWLFGTESTNFIKMENDVNAMITSAEKISYMPKDSSEYDVGILEINHRSQYLKNSLLDARVFLYVSSANLFFTLMLAIGVMGISKMWVKNEN